MSYIVEWNYGRENFPRTRWYGYGADAENPPSIFADLDEACAIFDMLVRTYYAPRYRVVDVESGVVVVESESEVDFREEYWEAPCADYAHTSSEVN